MAAAEAAAVTAELPPPQPLPEPEPVPVLPRAALTVPETALAGSIMEVGLEGPQKEFDYVRVVDAAGDWVAEVAVCEAPVVTLRLPFEPGPMSLSIRSKLPRSSRANRWQSPWLSYR